MSVSEYERNLNCLFMCRQHRYRAMKSKPFGRAMLENRIIKTMVAGNIDDDINIFILNELFDGFLKIKSCDKIKLRIIFSKLF